MAKFALPDFVKAVASAFVQVVEQRVMQAIAKGSQVFANAASVLKGMANVSTPAPIAVRANMPLGLPRGNGPRR